MFNSASSKSTLTAAAAGQPVASERPVLSTGTLNEQARDMVGGGEPTDGLGFLASLRMAREKTEITRGLRSEVLKLTSGYALDLVRHQFANELAQRKYELSAEGNLKLAQLHNKVMDSGYAWLQALQETKETSLTRANRGEALALRSLDEQRQRGEITPERFEERARQLVDDYNGLMGLSQQFDAQAKLSVAQLLALTLSQPHPQGS